MLRSVGYIVIQGLKSRSTSLQRSRLTSASASLFRNKDADKVCGIAGQRFLNQSATSTLDNHGLDCLQFDFSKVDFYRDSAENASNVEIMNEVLKSDVESMKPHIVYVQHLQEGHYIMKLKMMLERLGYESVFHSTNNGRGQATFIRHDLAPENINASVYKSGLPDPSL